VRKISYIALVLLLFTAHSVLAESLCFDEAGRDYGINPRILRAIAKVESNYNPRAINRNTNGTYDFGVMQINSLWYAVLGKEKWKTLGDPCTNIKTGASILSSCIESYGYTWEAIGCYNSRTPDKRDRYAKLVFRQMQRIERGEKELKESFQTALQDRIDALATAGPDSRVTDRAIKIRTSVPVTTGVLRNMVAPSDGNKQASPDQGVALKESSEFEVKGGDM
jgi:Transglycosylase SLT domain